MEFALFLIPLLLILFAIVDLGQAWYKKQMLVAATREGARYGAMYDSTGTVTSTAVENYVKANLQNAGFPNAATAVVNVVHPAPPATSQTGQDVKVTVTSYTAFWILGSLIPSLNSMSISASTVMRHE